MFLNFIIKRLETISVRRNDHPSMAYSAPTPETLGPVVGNVLILSLRYVGVNFHKQHLYPIIHYGLWGKCAAARNFGP